MIAYLHKAPRSGYILTICEQPCNGTAFNSAEKIPVAGKREANAICKTRDITPWNF